MPRPLDTIFGFLDNIPGYNFLGVGNGRLLSLGTDAKDYAAVASSEARPSQEAAASSMGADPAPTNIRSELISGAAPKNSWHINSRVTYF